MKLNFINDPTPFVFKAFDDLFPDLAANIQLNPELDGAACTTFPDDGGTPLIDVSADIPISALPEILAHELAHVAKPEDEHDPEWQKAFALIFERAHEMYVQHYEDYYSNHPE